MHQERGTQSAHIAETTVMLLAGGLGTRLRPLTHETPKVMLPLSDGKPMLEHIILLFHTQGFRRFVINLHHLPDVITDYFGDGSRFGVEIAYSDEKDKLLETAGAIKKAEAFLSDPFLVIYTDMIHFFDMRPVLAFHREKHALATIVLARTGIPQDGDIAEVDPQTSRIIKWHRRPHNIRAYDDKYWWNAALYVLSKEVIKHVPMGEPVKLDSAILPPLIESGGPVYGFTTHEEIYDSGTMEKYEFVKKWHQEHTK